MAKKDEEQLSQEEIDSLLGEVENLDLGEESDRSDEVREYDFASQERIVSGSMSGLYAINERFVRNFRTSLANLLRRNVNVAMIEITSIKAQEYFSSLAMPSCMNLFRMRPLQGISVCVFDTPLVFNLVDSLFGGGAITLERKQEKEEFTQMEMRIVHLVLDLAFNDLSNAWQTIYPVKFDLQGFEINPQLVNVASANEVMIVGRYKIMIEGTKGSELHLSIPYSTLEPIRTTLESGTLEKEDVDEVWVNRLKEEVFDAPIDFRGSIGYTEMRFKDLLALKSGDILPIDMYEYVTVYAGGLPTFRAKFGTSNDNCAIKIVSRVDRR